MIRKRCATADRGDLLPRAGQRVCDANQLGELGVAVFLDVKAPEVTGADNCRAKPAARLGLVDQKRRSMFQRLRRR